MKWAFWRRRREQAPPKPSQFDLLLEEARVSLEPLMVCPECGKEITDGDPAQRGAMVVRCPNGHSWTLTLD